MRSEQELRQRTREKLKRESATTLRRSRRKLGVTFPESNDPGKQKGS